jgi:Ca-activated chloride channel family protein
MIEMEFHFLRAGWILLIPISILLIFFFKRRMLTIGNWEKLIDKRLLPYVMSRRQLSDNQYKWWLISLISVLSIIALAGPTWERIEQPSFRTDQSLVIALDLSRSMNAQDITPNRLTRAKLKILDILERRQGAQVALIVYSANAFTVTPLTSDTDTIIALINSIDTSIMPSRGSYPALAIDKGLQLLNQASVSNGEIILVTDGGITSDSFSSAQKLRDEGYRLSALGIGSMNGAPIPKETGGFITDSTGQITISRLEVDDLKDLVEIGGGSYTSITSNDQDIDTLLSEVYSAVRESDDSVTTDQWKEFGPWLLLIVVPFGSLLFRKGWVFVFLLTIMPIDNSVYALDWNDLWKTRDQQAKEAMESGDYDKAIELFEDSEWLAAAHYKAGNYRQSANGYNNNSNIDHLYNHANSLAKIGQFEEAIENYEKVIAEEPNAEDALYNLNLLKDLLSENQSSEENNDDGQSSEEASTGEQSQQQNGDESEQSDNEGNSKTGDSDDESDANPNQKLSNEEDIEAIEKELERAAEENSNQEPQQEDNNESGLEGRMAQEQQQAMEQWLRRIPDDPGGLLRRKFRYQYQRQGIDQDGNQIWPNEGAQPW